MSVHILYIHGFNSSPLSYKAQATKAYLADTYPDITYHCPQLAVSPQQAIEQLTTLIEKSLVEDSLRGETSDTTWYLLGSSLGGYYASFLSEKYGFKAVLINPAVKPYLLLTDYLGEQKNYHTGEAVVIKKSFMDELKKHEQINLTKKNYLVMLQTGDEVLDYRQAEEKYHGCQLVLEQGGDHSFVNYQQHLTHIMRFFQLTS